MNIKVDSNIKLPKEGKTFPVLSGENAICSVELCFENKTHFIKGVK